MNYKKSAENGDYIRSLFRYADQLDDHKLALKYYKQGDVKAKLLLRHFNDENYDEYDIDESEDDGEEDNDDEENDNKN